MYVRESFIGEPVDKYWGPAWHLLFDKYILGDWLQLYHEQRGVISAEDTDKILWDTWTGLRAPLFAGVVGSFEYQTRYNSEPAEGTNTTDTTFRFKLGYQW